MKDLFDQTVSTPSAEAAAAYDRAVDAHLHAWPGVPGALQAATAAAPDFALPHALQALVLAGWGRRADALQALARAQSAVGGATPREQSQVALFSAILEGRTRDALGLVVEHARCHPTDLLAASTALGAYGLFAFSGRADHDAARLDFIETLAAHHGAPPPWLQAQRGWARIEAGRVDEGLTLAQQAIVLRPDNGHNAHIVVHGLFEAGRHDDTLAFIDRWLPAYPADGVMWGHLHWHAALAELALEREDAAVSRLQGPITDYLPRGMPFMGLPDLVSLLWRLGLRGRRGLPWELARHHAQRHFAQGSNVFGELHLALLAAAWGDRDALQAVAARLPLLQGRGLEGAAVALQWVNGLAALGRGDEATARHALDAACDGAVRLGGSRAQRDLLQLTTRVLQLASLWGMAGREVR
jgi:hypothetical protein